MSFPGHNIQAGMAFYHEDLLYCRFNLAPTLLSSARGYEGYGLAL